MSLAPRSWWQAIISGWASRQPWRRKQSPSGLHVRRVSVESLEDRTVLSAVNPFSGHLDRPPNVTGSAQGLLDHQVGSPTGDASGAATHGGGVSGAAGGASSSGPGYPTLPAQNPAPLNDQLVQVQQSLSFNSLRPDIGSLLANAPRTAASALAPTQPPSGAISLNEAGPIVGKPPGLLTNDTQALAQSSTPSGLLLGLPTQRDVGNAFVIIGTAGQTPVKGVAALDGNPTGNAFLATGARLNAVPTPATLKTLQDLEQHWPVIVDTLFESGQGSQRAKAPVDGTALSAGPEQSAASQSPTSPVKSEEPALVLDSRPETLVVAGTLEDAKGATQSPVIAPAAPLDASDPQIQGTRLLTGLVVSVLFASGLWKATWRSGQNAEREERPERALVSPTKS